MNLATKIMYMIGAFLSVIPSIAFAHAETGWNGGMMSWGGMMGGAWGWFIFLPYLVWLAVGIFLAVWLWQKITDKK